MDEVKKAATARHFDGVADHYRGVTRPPQATMRNLLAALGCPPESLVLDAGCGAGLYSIALADAGYRVTGLDLAPEMIAQARDLATERGQSDEALRFAVGDIERLEADGGAFDAILCRAVLDFAPRPAQALAEFRRVLRPHGHLVLITLGAYSPVKYRRWRRFLPDEHYPAVGNDLLPWEAEALLEHLGWQIIAQEPSFAPSYWGTANRYGEADSRRLADRIWQQTIATTWQCVAVRPDG